MVVLHGQAYVTLQSQAVVKSGDLKSPSSFLNETTTTLLHTIYESEKKSYVAHVNSYLRDDPFMNQFLPIDPATNALFELARDGVLLWYLRTVCFIMLFSIVDPIFPSRNMRYLYRVFTFYFFKSTKKQTNMVCTCKARVPPKSPMDLLCCRNLKVVKWAGWITCQNE